MSDTEGATVTNRQLEQAIERHNNARGSAVDIYAAAATASMLIPVAPASAGGGPGSTKAATFNASDGGKLVPGFTSQQLLEDKMGSGWPFFTASVDAMVNVAQANGFGIVINPGPGELVVVDGDLADLGAFLQQVAVTPMDVEMTITAIEPAEGLDTLSEWLAATLTRWQEVIAAAVFVAVEGDARRLMCGLHIDDTVPPAGVDDILASLGRQVGSVLTGDQTVDFIRLESSLLARVHSAVTPVYVRPSGAAGWISRGAR